MSMSNKTETEIQKRETETKTKPTTNQMQNKTHASSAGKEGGWEEDGAWHAEIGN